MIINISDSFTENLWLIYITLDLVESAFWHIHQRLSLIVSSFLSLFECYLGTERLVIDWLREWLLFWDPWFDSLEVSRKKYFIRVISVLSAVLTSKRHMYINFYKHHYLIIKIMTTILMDRILLLVRVFNLLIYFYP